jgi:TonB family protein
MKRQIPTIMAMLAASLGAPRTFGQHATAELDRMPIFGMPADPKAANRTYLGIDVRDTADGVVVTQVDTDSPAAKAGFKAGDLVLDYNGQDVEVKAQLSRLLSETPPGRQVNIHVLRGGARFTFTPTVESFGPTVESFGPTVEFFGLPQAMPTVITTVPPEYTPEALKAGIQGTVTVYVEVGVDGRAYRARVVKGLGYGLDAKALAALEQWRFIPAKRNGVPVACPATIEMNFRPR